MIDIHIDKHSGKMNCAGTAPELAIQIGVAIQSIYDMFGTKNDFDADVFKKLMQKIINDETYGPFSGKFVTVEQGFAVISSKNDLTKQSGKDDTL